MELTLHFVLLNVAASCKVEQDRNNFHFLAIIIRFGSRCFRIFRLLLLKKHMEQKQVTHLKSIIFIINLHMLIL